MVLSSVLALFSVVVFGQASQPAQSGEGKQNTFVLGAQLRPCFHVRDGYVRPLRWNEDPITVVLNRIRLSVDYTYLNKVQLYISMQNVNVYGQSAQVQTIDRAGGFSVFRAWAKLSTNSFAFVFGRQAISLDNERLFGELDWHPSARSHDALQVQYTDKKGMFQAKAFVAYNVNLFKNTSVATGAFNVFQPYADPYVSTGAQPYQNLQLLWLHVKPNGQQGISLLWNSLGFENAALKRMFFLQTMGAYWTMKAKPVTLSAEGYYQTGTTAQVKASNAFLIAASAKYSLPKGTYFAVGSDYLSGNDSVRGLTNFNPLYGTHHKFYGFIDHFYVGADPVQRQYGLWDKYLVVGHQYASVPLNVLVKGHWFHSAKPVTKARQYIQNNLPIIDPKRNSGRNIGYEMDVVASIQLYPFVLIQSGYSVYFPTLSTPIVHTSLNGLDGAPIRAFQQFVWLCVRVSPDLFRTSF